MYEYDELNDCYTYVPPKEPTPPIFVADYSMTLAELLEVTKDLPPEDVIISANFQFPDDVQIEVSVRD